MSDISMPPEPPKPAKKHLFDRPLPKALLTLVGLLAPMPLLLALTNIWLNCCAPAEQKSFDPFTIIRQIFDGGGGDPPFMLLPLSLALPALLLIVLYRRSGLILLAVLFVLLATAGGEAFFFLQQTRG